MTKPKKTDPLTAKEVKHAAILFFDLFEEVMTYAPEGTTIEDNLKFCESVFALAHKRRALDIEADAAVPFGFNKKEA